MPSLPARWCLTLTCYQGPFAATKSLSINFLARMAQSLRSRDRNSVPPNVSIKPSRGKVEPLDFPLPSLLVPSTAEPRLTVPHAHPRTPVACTESVTLVKVAPQFQQSLTKAPADTDPRQVWGRGDDSTQEEKGCHLGFCVLFIFFLTWDII